jgi:beta-glucosidase
MKKSFTATFAAITAIAAISVIASAKEPSKVLLLDNFESAGIKFESPTKAVTATGEQIYSGWNGPASAMDISIQNVAGAEGSKALSITLDREDWCGSQIQAAKDGMWKDPISGDWDAIRFMFKGEGSGMEIGIDLPDAGNEFHRYILTDDSEDWRVVEIPFTDFEHRSDWQPDDQDNNETLDWPVKELKFEPYSNGQLQFYIDKVELVKY